MAVIFKTTEVQKHRHLVLLSPEQELFYTSVQNDHDHQVILVADQNNNPIVIIGEAPDGHKHDLTNMDEVLKPPPSKKKLQEEAEKALDLFKTAAKLEEKPRKRGEESVDFIEGCQWDKATKQNLKENNRAALTLNYLQSQIDVLSGVFRQNRLDPRAFPTEGSDSGVADISTASLMWISKANRLSVHGVRVFEDVLTPGRGLFHVGITQDENPLGEVFIERFPWRDGYFGKHNELDASDATHAHKAKWLPLGEAKAKYPEKAERIEQVMDVSRELPEGSNISLVQSEGSRSAIIDKYATDPEIIDNNHKRVRFIEHEIKEFRTAYIAVDAGLTLEQEISKQEAELARTLPNISVLELSRYRMKVVITLGTEPIRVFYPKRPYKGFSITPCYGYKYDQDRGWNGKIHFLKDSQREFNKRASQIVDAANVALNPGFVHEPETFTSDKQKREFERNASKPGVNLEINNLDRPPMPKQNPQFPSELFALQKSNIETMQVLSNIPPALAGQASPYQSGRAGTMQRQSGLVGNERFFDNFVLSMQVVYQKAFKLMQEVYEPERIARIVMSEAADPRRMENLEIGQQAIPAKRDPQQDQQIYGEIVKMLETTDLTKYDIVIGEQPLSPSMKEAELRMWLEARQMGVQVPPAMLVELSSLPNKKKWAQIMEQLYQQQMEMERMKYQAELEKARAYTTPANNNQQ